MSNWRQKVGPASFRGVKFFVDTTEHAGGRRDVTHEYPFRDDPFLEDVGRRSRSFPVEAYVVGDDYIDQRDALLRALEESGPGELVHPSYGTRRVAVPSFRAREAVVDSGMARFSIDFVETRATDEEILAPLVDASGALSNSAGLARTAVQSQFLNGYVVGPLMASVTTSVINLTSTVDSLLDNVSVEEQQLATLKLRLSHLAQASGSLIRVPSDLFLSLVGVFELLDSIPLLLAAYAFNPGTRPASITFNRAREQTCFDELRFATQRLAAIRAAELLPAQTFDSYDSAVAARQSVADLLDDQAASASDDTYPALLQLRADITKAIPGADSDLPHLLIYTPPSTVSSLVLAHRLYGNTLLELDLVARNHIRHPGFILGGAELEVLSSE